MVWIDECLVYLQTIPRTVLVKREMKNVLYPTKKHVGKINVWAANSCFGKISIHIFDGVLTFNKYIKILNNKLIE